MNLKTVEFYAGPPMLGGPDDLDLTIRDFLAGAKKSLFIAVQELDSRAIAEAGVDVITDLNPAIFHQKFIVRDPGEPSGAVLTGSTNFTLTDTGMNPPGNSAKTGNNLNHIVVLHGEHATDQYLAEFNRLRSATFGELHERREPRPAEFGLAGIRIKPIFAPEQGPEMEIMKQMLKAATSIDFAMFTFASSSGIDDTMIRLVGQLNRLLGVLDRGQGVQQWSATQPPSHPATQSRRSRAVREQARATTLNDENILVIGDLEETDPAAEAAQRQVAAFALAEINRIITTLSQPI